MARSLALAEFSDEQLATVLQNHPNRASAAEALGVPRETLRNVVKRRGLIIQNQVVPASGMIKAVPALTRDSLHQAIQPPNTCRVKALLDTLDAESFRTLEEALSYGKDVFSATALRNWLVESGIDESLVPGVDAINDHRAGRGRCRCKG